MLQTIKHYGSVSLAYLKMALLTTLEYPTSLFGWLLANPIQFIVGFATIKFVVEEFGTIAGWGYGELAVLYGVSVISHGLCVVFFIQSWYVGYYVVDGDFDRCMLRPMSVLYQFLFTGFNPIGLTDLIPGICVFIYGCIQVDFVWSIGNVINILIILIGATLIRSAVYLMIGCSAFWTKSVNSYNGYVQEFFSKTTTYPLSIFPESFQFVLTFLLPIGWVNFYPVAELLGVPNGRFAWNGAVWATLAAGVLIFLVASAIFKSGLKRYESAGN